MVCLAITAPALIVSADLPFFKAEQLLIPIVAGVYLWMLLAGMARPIRLNAMFAIGLLFCLCNAISIWFGARILGHPVILRDLYELPKVWLPVAFFTIGYEAYLTERSLRKLARYFSLAVVLVCAYAWSQFFGLGFAYKINPYYSPGGHIDAALEYARRVYGTVGNANVLGELMVWCTVILLLAALLNVSNRVSNMAIALACVVTLVMTGSRYGVVNLALALLLILWLATRSKQRRFAPAVLLLLLIPVFVGTYQTVASTNRRTLERYQTLQDPLGIDSLRQRVDDVWLEAWKDFNASLLFGHGPGKAFLSRADRFIDSEYLDVLREKGSIGFIVFMAYYLYPLTLLLRGRRTIGASDGLLAELAPASAWCVQVGLIMGILALVMDIGMATFYSPFLQGFLWLWMGIGSGCAARLAAPLRPRLLAPISPPLLQPGAVQSV
jgi:hypothetical protein